MSDVTHRKRGLRFEKSQLVEIETWARQDEFVFRDFYFINVSYGHYERFAYRYEYVYFVYSYLTMHHVYQCVYIHICISVCIYAYMYICMCVYTYEVHTISFQTFFVWAFKIGVDP